MLRSAVVGDDAALCTVQSAASGMTLLLLLLVVVVVLGGEPGYMLPARSSWPSVQLSQDSALVKESAARSVLGMMLCRSGLLLLLFAVKLCSGAESAAAAGTRLGMLPLP